MYMSALLYIRVLVMREHSCTYEYSVFCTRVLENCTRMYERALTRHEKRALMYIFTCVRVCTCVYESGRVFTHTHMCVGV